MKPRSGKSRTNSVRGPVNGRVRLSRPSTGGNRWKGWVASLIGRYSRSSATTADSRMSLVCAFTWLVQQRRQVLYQNLLPRISLAIQPMFLDQRSFPRPPSSLVPLLPTSVPQRRGAADHSGYRRVAHAVMQPNHTVARPHVSPPIGVTPLHHSPLAMAVQRLMRIEQSGATHFQKRCTGDRVETLVRRIVRRTRRVEEPISGSSPSVVRPTLRPTERPVVQDEQGPVSAVRPRRNRTPDGYRHTQSGEPAVDIEALTNQVVRQIDRRITAWRERTGRI